MMSDIPTPFSPDTGLRSALESIAGWRQVNISGEYEHGLRDIIRSITDCAAAALEASPVVAQTRGLTAEELRAKFGEDWGPYGAALAPGNGAVEAEIAKIDELIGIEEGETASQRVARLVDSYVDLQKQLAKAAPSPAALDPVTVEAILNHHFYTGEPGQHGAIKAATAALLAPSRVTSTVRVPFLTDAMIQAAAKVINPMAFEEVDDPSPLFDARGARQEARKEAREILIAALGTVAQTDKNRGE